MEFNKKRALKLSALLIASFSFISLCFTLVSGYFFDIEALAVVLPFVSLFCENALVSVLFVYMICAFSNIGTKFMISRALLLSSIVFLFSLPPYVARGIEVYKEPFDILFGALASSLFDFVMILFRLTLIFLFMLLVLKLLYKKASPTHLLGQTLSAANPLIPSTAGSVALFVCPASLFAISFVSEAFDTVSFFIKEFDTYRIGELIYIVVYYIYLVPVLLFCLFLSKWVKGLFYSKKDNR